MPYRIEYDPEAARDLYHHRGPGEARVRRAIDTQLPREPMRETRNRFRAEPNGLGEWELREPPFRVFYDVYEDEQLVYVKAVVSKHRERTYRRGRRISTHE